MASQEDIDRLVSLIQVLKNKDLINICMANHLAKSGNKAELQRRILNLIDSAYQDPNPRKFHDIQTIILNFGPGSYRGTSSIPSSPSYLHSGMSSPYNSHANGLNGAGNPLLGADITQRQQRNGHIGLQFKPSPFYQIDCQLGEVRHCEAMANHRNSIPVSLRASTFPELQRCLTDPSLRVMIFCSSSNIGVQDVAFPYQCEIKVNGGEVKANLRGLKNKPGSTRPVDVTNLLRLKPPNYSNTLEFTYALTSKRFYLAIYLCKTLSADALASVIERRARITKTSVIRELTKQAQDPDIVATSQVLSLKCPLTYMRLSLPIRATTCRHIQCFDATSYLQLQEQGPQWLCPVCSHLAPFESLAVDEYVRDILENTSSDLDQITIDPDGTWNTGQAKNGRPSTPKRAETSYVDDEDDFIIPTSVQSVQSVNSVNSLTGSASGQNAVSAVVAAYREFRDATVSAGRAPSMAASKTGSQSQNQTAGQKRQREVIDLTLSDDDDDEADARPVKRQNTAVSGFSPGPYPTIA